MKSGSIGFYLFYLRYLLRHHSPKRVFRASVGRYRRKYWAKRYQIGLLYASLKREPIGALWGRRPLPIQPRNFIRKKRVGGQGSDNISPLSWTHHGLSLLFPTPLLPSVQALVTHLPWECHADAHMAMRTISGMVDLPGGFRTVCSQPSRWHHDPYLSLVTGWDRKEAVGLYCHQQDQKRIWSLARGDGLSSLGRWAWIALAMDGTSSRGVMANLAYQRQQMPNSRERVHFLHFPHTKVPYEHLQPIPSYHPHRWPNQLTQIHAQCAAVFKRMVVLFIRENPTGKGTQWSCTMEVALRTVNWLLTWELLAPLEPKAGEGGQSAQFEEWYLRPAILEHARFIRHNLEDAGLAPNNHMVAGLVALLMVGLAHKDQGEGRGLEAWATKALNRQIERQVLAGGESFEGSSDYHRLATELFLLPLLLKARAGGTMGSAYHSRCHAMFRVLRDLTMITGRGPQLGDVDGGRILWLDSRDPSDVRGLLAVAAFFFGDQSLLNPHWDLAQVGPLPVWLFGQAFIDYFGSLGECGAHIAQETPTSTGNDGNEDLSSLGGAPLANWGSTAVTQTDSGGSPSRLVHHPGLGGGIFRGSKLHVFFQCGPTGQDGMGGHAHNDGLSLVAQAGKVPLLSDPGTFVYVSNPAQRNLYRSTGFHSTLGVGEAEQCPLWEKRLFFLPDVANVRLLGMEDYLFGVRSTADSLATLSGTHEGYRNDLGIIHHRQVDVLDGEQVLLVRDFLEGTGSLFISITFRFPHSAGGRPLKVRRIRSAKAIVAYKDLARRASLPAAPDLRQGAETYPAPLFVIPAGPNPLTLKLWTGWVAPTYGIRFPSPAITLWGLVKLPYAGTVVIWRPEE